MHIDEIIANYHAVHAATFAKYGVGKIAQCTDHGGVFTVIDESGRALAFDHRIIITIRAGNAEWASREILNQFATWVAQRTDIADPIALCKQPKHSTNYLKTLAPYVAAAFGSHTAIVFDNAQLQALICLDNPRSVIMQPDLLTQVKRESAAIREDVLRRIDE